MVSACRSFKRLPRGLRKLEKELRPRVITEPFSESNGGALSLMKLIQSKTPPRVVQELLDSSGLDVDGSFSLNYPEC